VKRIIGVIAVATIFATMLVAAIAPALAATTSENLLKNLTIASTTVDPEAKMVTVEGTVSCTPKVARAYVAVGLKQTVGSAHKTEAFHEKRLRPCDGRTPFSLQLTAEEQFIIPGKATLRGFAGTCLRADGRCDFDRTGPMEVWLLP
jgi:hypothetical protein